ncbi:hypothetical protein LY90DRAFT_668913 [Neocallimastix californiae]|uniref:Uncharacterized protein n=1 Tax=Neocallimastix californiae TaxID=1754190 RepID=A0A1Y2DI85_9FUNG|nr:hypothetical protein LY90DRAFT_668913 [Neocallimastix californiae]|eukprot:ORY58948.1 hypothetical protein LY90DRAFT_668913 [Neocallimastix californiae]
MSIIKTDDNINNLITNNSLTEEQFDLMLNQTVNSDIFQISSLQFNISSDHSKDLEIYEPPETSIEKIKQELNDMNFFEESNENHFQEYDSVGNVDNIDIGNRKSLIEIYEKNKSIDSIQSIKINNSLNLSLSNSFDAERNTSKDTIKAISKSPENDFSFQNEHSIIGNSEKNQSQHIVMNDINNSGVSSILLSKSRNSKDHNSLLFDKKDIKENNYEKKQNDLNNSNQKLTKPPLPSNYISSQSTILDSSIVNNNEILNKNQNSLPNMDKTDSLNKSTISENGANNLINNSTLNKVNETSNVNILNRSQSSNKSLLNNIVEESNINSLNKSQSSNRSLVNNIIEKNNNKSDIFNKSHNSKSPLKKELTSSTLYTKEQNSLHDIVNYHDVSFDKHSIYEYINNMNKENNTKDINNLVLKELTEECKHLKNLNEVQLKLNKELESKLELKNQENKNEINNLKEKYENMISNIQEIDNKKTVLLHNKIKLLENQLIETNESQVQIASIQRNFQEQQELNILNIKNDLLKKYEDQIQEIIEDKENFMKKVEMDHQKKQTEFMKEKSHLQDEIVNMKEEVEEKNKQILELKTLLEKKPITNDFSQQYDKGLEETQKKLDIYKTEVDAVRSLLYSNISYPNPNINSENEQNQGQDQDQSQSNDNIESTNHKKSHENYLKSLSLSQLLKTYIQQINHDKEQINKLKMIDKNKDNYVNEMEQQIKNLESTQKQIMLENQNSVAFVENKYLNEINEQKKRYENELNELRNKYEKVIEELQIKSEQIEEIASKKSYPESSLSELMQIYPNEFEDFKNEIESVVWKKLDEAWHERFREDLTTASARITQHCSEAYASAIAKLKTQSIAFKNKLENEFEKKFRKYVEERNKETNHLQHKYEQNQKELEELKKQLSESKKTVKSLTQVTYKHSQAEEKYQQALLDMKALYKSRLKKMYEDISKKKKEWIDQKIENEREWENKFNKLKSEYYNKIKQTENELKIIKSQIPLKQRTFKNINELEDQPDRESLNNAYTESEFYSNADDESFLTTTNPNMKYYSRN